jgi:lysozyme family protein
VNNPKDPGGETNYGITKATARSHGYTGNMHDIPMSVVERIYRESYWKGCDALPAGVDLCVFDFAVNSGPGAHGASTRQPRASIASVTSACASCVASTHGRRSARAGRSVWS